MSTLADVLGRVSALRVEIEEGGRQSEELRTCPMALVESLRGAGLFYLKVPAALGGLEMSFTDQMQVYEEVARLDSNIGWTVIIGNGAGGIVGTRLSDEALPKVYSGPRPPLMAAALAPPAVGIPHGDGYLVSGRASFGSGIRHAEWVSVGGFVADETGTVDMSLGHRVFVFPQDVVTVHDNWDVAGLQGTGSCDFSFEDVQVDREFVIDLFNGEARRGGPAFRMPGLLLVANEHISFPLGVARRALDEATATAQGKLRLGNTTTIAHRGSFQEELGYHDIALRSARLLAFDTIGRLSELMEREGKPEPGTQADVMAVATYVTKGAIDVCTWAFKAGGAHGLYRPHPLQRCLRDMMAAGNHIYVKDENFDIKGRSLLGMT